MKPRHAARLAATICRSCVYRFNDNHDLFPETATARGIFHPISNSRYTILVAQAVEMLPLEVVDREQGSADWSGRVLAVWETQNRGSAAVIQKGILSGTPNLARNKKM
jgi:hypothetical protein